MRWAVAVLILSSCGAPGGTPRTAFDGAQALQYIETQLAFGPRIPGTDGHHAAGDWIVSEMTTRADTVMVQAWLHVTAAGDTLPLRNVLGRFNVGAPGRILYVAHWDTRPVADRDPDPANRERPVPGANDGASGVALLMALADVFVVQPPNVGVDLLFVDGEDYGSFDDPELRDVLIGSRYFAQHLPDPDYAPLFGVVWDMIGDANLRISQEGHSVQGAPEVVQRVWRTADDLGYGRVFANERIGPITDDHVPLLDAGLRVIDVIDIAYPSRSGVNYHHTVADLIDKVSAASLQVVGDVAVTLVQAI